MKRYSHFSASPLQLLPCLLAVMVMALLGFSACEGNADDIQISRHENAFPRIFPDYKDVVVPCNIAPMNFNYLGKEPCAVIVKGKGGTLQIEGEDGLIAFPAKTWRKLLQENKGGGMELTVAVKRGDQWVGFKPFHMYVAPDSIDPWVSYRLLPPGHQAWYNMGIYQRNLENFDQSPIYENKLTKHNCVNCHSYWKGNPRRMLFHSRADYGGTLMMIDGHLEKLDTKTDSTMGFFVYPYWHPSGRYVAFSVNKTRQNFFAHDKNRIEVYDSASDVIVYDVFKHTVAYSPHTHSPAAFETFPTFSPDGKSLYFCCATAVAPMPERYKDVKYNLVRIGFNPATMGFGDKVDTIVNARLMGKSISFPRVSPDGRYLAYTLHGYGNFSIWHKDADLYMVDLRTLRTYPLAAANSNDVDSYHSWSSNSRWLIFSSRRTNGLFTRPFITYIDHSGKAHKSFLLPQRNPLHYYRNLMVSYNIPELMRYKVTVSQHDMARTLRKEESVGVKLR